jgi:two-component system sensor histidine kinase TorS
MKRVRKALNAPGLPVIAMSAHVFTSEVERYLNSGVDAFVAKPIIDEQLLEAIGTLTDRVPAGTALAAFDDAACKADVDALGLEVVRRLHRIAQDSLPRRFEAMNEALRTNDRKALRDLAHATKSSAGSLGFPRLLAASVALETASASGAAAELKHIVSECEAAFAAGFAELDQMLPADTSAERTAAE